MRSWLNSCTQTQYTFVSSPPWLPEWYYVFVLPWVTECKSKITRLDPTLDSVHDQQTYHAHFSSYGTYTSPHVPVVGQWCLPPQTNCSRVGCSCLVCSHILISMKKSLETGDCSRVEHHRKGQASQALNYKEVLHKCMEVKEYAHHASVVIDLCKICFTSKIQSSFTPVFKC